MKTILDSYAPNETIPVRKHLKNKKLAKYFNRETAAALVSVSKLFDGDTVNCDMPFYYATALVAYEDYGLNNVVAKSIDSNKHFSQELFVKQAMPAVSPLTQFKALYNMPLCFISIEFDLNGDNAVIYHSAQALLTQAMNSPSENVLIGAGKVHSSGQVETGFALLAPQQIQPLTKIDTTTEAIQLFRDWNN